MNYHEKIADLAAQGQVEGEDFCSVRQSSKHFSIHRPLNAGEYQSLIARYTDETGDIVKKIIAARTVALSTCIYPVQRLEVEMLFDRYGASPQNVCQKLIDMAGGSEYTDPKEEV